MMARLQSQIEVYEALHGGEAPELRHFYKVLEAASTTLPSASEMVRFEGGARTKQTARKATSSGKHVGVTGKVIDTAGKGTHKNSSGLPPMVVDDEHTLTDFNSLRTSKSRAKYLEMVNPATSFNSLWFQLNDDEKQIVNGKARTYIESDSFEHFYNEFSNEKETIVEHLTSKNDGRIKIAHTALRSGITKKVEKLTDDAKATLHSHLLPIYRAPALFDRILKEDPFRRVVLEILVHQVIKPKNLENVEMQFYTFKLGIRIVTTYFKGAGVKRGSSTRTLVEFKGMLSDYPQAFHYVSENDLPEAHHTPYKNAYKKLARTTNTYKFRRLPDLASATTLEGRVRVFKKLVKPNTVAWLYNEYGLQLATNEKKEVTDTLMNILKGQYTVFTNADDTRKQFINNHKQYFKGESDELQSYTEFAGTDEQGPFQRATQEFAGLNNIKDTALKDLNATLAKWQQYPAFIDFLKANLSSQNDLRRLLAHSSDKEAYATSDNADRLIENYKDGAITVFPWVLHFKDHNDGRAKLEAKGREWSRKYAETPSTSASKSTTRKEVVVKVYTRAELYDEYKKLVNYDAHFQKPASVTDDEWNRGKQLWTEFSNIYWTATEDDLKDQASRVNQPFEAPGFWFDNVAPVEAGFSLPVPTYLTQKTTKNTMGAPWIGSGLVVWQNDFIMNNPHDIVLDTSQPLNFTDEGGNTTLSIARDVSIIPSKEDIDKLDPHQKTWATMYLRVLLNRHKKNKPLDKLLNGDRGSTDTGLQRWFPEFQYRRADMASLLPFYLNPRDGDRRGIKAKQSNGWKVLDPLVMDLTGQPGHYRLFQNIATLKKSKQKTVYRLIQKQYQAKLMDGQQGVQSTFFQSLADTFFRIRARMPALGMVKEGTNTSNDPLRTDEQKLIDAIYSLVDDISNKTPESVVEEYPKLKSIKPSTSKSGDDADLTDDQKMSRARSVLKAMSSSVGHVNRTRREAMLTPDDVQAKLLAIYNKVSEYQETQRKENEIARKANRSTSGNRNSRVITSFEQNLEKAASDIKCDRRRVARYLEVFLKSKKQDGETDAGWKTRVQKKLESFLASVCVSRKLRRMKVLCRAAANAPENEQNSKYVTIADKIWESWKVPLPDQTAIGSESETTDWIRVQLIKNLKKPGFCQANMAKTARSGSQRSAQYHKEMDAFTEQLAVQIKDLHGRKDINVETEFDKIKKLAIAVMQAGKLVQKLESNNPTAVESFNDWDRADELYLKAFTLKTATSIHILATTYAARTEWKKQTKAFGKDSHFTQKPSGKVGKDAKALWRASLEVVDVGETSKEASEVVQSENVDSANEGAQEVTPQATTQTAHSYNLRSRSKAKAAPGRNPRYNFRSRNKRNYFGGGGNMMDVDSDFEGGAAAKLRYPPRRGDTELGPEFKTKRCDLAYMLEDLLKEVFVYHLHTCIKHMGDNTIGENDVFKKHMRPAREALVLLRLLTTGNARVDPSDKSNTVSRLTCMTTIEKDNSVSKAVNRACYRKIGKTKNRLWLKLGVAERLRKENCGDALPAQRASRAGARLKPQTRPAEDANGNANTSSDNEEGSEEESEEATTAVSSQSQGQPAVNAIEEKNASTDNEEEGSEEESEEATTAVSSQSQGQPAVNAIEEKNASTDNEEGSEEESEEATTAVSSQSQGQPAVNAIEEKNASTDNEEEGSEDESEEATTAVSSQSQGQPAVNAIEEKNASSDREASEDESEEATTAVSSQSQGQPTDDGANADPDEEADLFQFGGDDDADQDSVSVAELDGAELDEYDQIGRFQEQPTFSDDGYSQPDNSSGELDMFGLKGGHSKHWVLDQGSPFQNF